MSPRRPTREELQAAYGKTLPDVLAPGLRVVFCGINPGLYTAAVGHHFARPGNRFWPALHEAGFTPRLLRPDEEQELLEYGCGITNLVRRATTAADELAREELIEGGRALEERLRPLGPGYVAFVGIGAYRTAFGRPRARLGPQEERIAGARVWALPSTSGLNAHHRPSDFADAFRALREAVDKGG